MLITATFRLIGKRTRQGVRPDTPVEMGGIFLRDTESQAFVFVFPCDVAVAVLFLHTVLPWQRTC